MIKNGDIKLNENNEYELTPALKKGIAKCLKQNKN
jgi:hypothetical protein